MDRTIVIRGESCTHRARPEGEGLRLVKRDGSEDPAGRLVRVFDGLEGEAVDLGEWVEPEQDDREIMITGEAKFFRARVIGERRGFLVLQVLHPDGAIDESWAAFKLQDGDYIDMGSWKEGPGGEDAN